MTGLDPSFRQLLKEHGVPDDEIEHLELMAEIMRSRVPNREEFELFHKLLAGIPTYHFSRWPDGTYKASYVQRAWEKYQTDFLES